VPSFSLCYTFGMDKEKLFKHPLTLIFSFFILLFAYSKFGPTIPFSVFSQDRGAPLVVEGTGEVSVVPDVAKVSLGIDESGATLDAVQKSANAKSKTLVDALKGLGIDEKDIKTTNYSVFPEYDYQGRTPRITGYRVSIAYEVKVKDFDKVNDVLVTVTSSGANVVGNVSFEVNAETKNKKMGEAREEAVKEAKQKAQSLASAAGVTLGKILNISETQQFPGPIALREAVGIGGAGVPTPDITPGETQFTVSVSVSWEIR